MHGRRDAVRREDDGGALGHLGLLLDEDRAARLEIAHDVDVVDDLLAHVDGRSVVVECLLDSLDGALDSCAVAARRGEEDALHHVKLQGRRWLALSGRLRRGGCPSARRRRP